VTKGSSHTPTCDCHQCRGTAAHQRYAHGDLADQLLQAIEEQRAELEAQAEPFIGRVSFHVDLDANLTMRRIQVSVRPCREPCPEEAA
jgi:hypothetical protein